MKNSKIVAQEAALAMWEARVGHRLAARLAEGADGLDADALIDRVMKKIPVPDKPLATHAP